MYCADGGGGGAGGGGMDRSPPADADTDISLHLQRAAAIIIKYRAPRTAISDLPHQNRNDPAAARPR